MVNGRTDRRPDGEASLRLLGLARSPAPGLVALELERLIAAGRSPDILASTPHVDRDLPPELAFVVGRAAEEEEDFGRARALFATVSASPDIELARRATAHLAHLDYYEGDFEGGLRRALSACGGPVSVHSIEAELSRSVNAMALNHSSEAMAAAVKAVNATQRIRPAWLRTDLRFRASRQLVHVLIARGAYVEATIEAERAGAIARRSGASRHLGIAAYLRAFVMSARGDRDALALFREADEQWGGPHHAFGRWLRYAWAMTLRDQGNTREARTQWASTSVRLVWEEPLFDLADGRITMTTTTGRTFDELPFVNATIGLLGAATGDLRLGRATLAEAMSEFRRCGLEHYRRGAALTLAALAVDEAPGEAAGILHEEMPGLVTLRLMRWPWWHRPLAERLARFCLARGIAVPYWRDLLRSMRPREDVDRTLRNRSLSEREIETVSTWLLEPELTRSELAGRLGVSEATARNLLHRARRKLGVGTRRGPEVLRARIHELLR